MPHGDLTDIGTRLWSAYREAVRARALRPATATDEDGAVRAAWRRKWAGGALGFSWLPVVMVTRVVVKQAPPERLYLDPAMPSGPSSASSLSSLLSPWLPTSWGYLVVLAGVTTAAGFVLPDLLDDRRWRRVQVQLQLVLPAYLDLLGLCTRAGLTLEAAIERVSAASDQTDPMAAQWRRVLSDIRLGTTRRHALEQMAQRVRLAELDGVVAALAQTEGLGVPVTATLHNQSRRLRERQRFRAEEAAQKVQVAILFPLVCCLLPALLLVVVGPAAVHILDVVQST